MSEPDEFDAQAEQLLPCHCADLPIIPSWQFECGHKPHCPAANRPAVAAALRVANLESTSLARELGIAERELADLRAENEDWKRQVLLLSERERSLLRALTDLRTENEWLKTCSECWARFHPAQYDGDLNQCPIVGDTCPQAHAKIAYRAVQGSLRAGESELADLRAERDELKARLAEAEKRGMERALKIILESEGDIDFAEFEIRAEMEKMP